MLKQVRTLVSQNKIRFQEDGFDLDLTYILSNVIAMGFPSEQVEGLFRNPLKDVQKFFLKRHQDHYKIYNLCSERDYPASKFDGDVVKYPFDDHNAPPLEMIVKFCADVENYVDEDELNVAAIHCKAGKGRTGLMICCYLIYAEIVTTAEQSMEFYGYKRTKDAQGVTIPSQSRYIHYFDEFYHRYRKPEVPFEFAGRPLILTCVRITNGSTYESWRPVFTIEKFGKVMIHDSRKSVPVRKYRSSVKVFEIRARFPVQGDSKMLFYHDDPMSEDHLFRFWFHTSFIKDGYLSLPKAEIDEVIKDKKSKRWDADMKVELYFEDYKDAPFVHRESNTLELPQDDEEYEDVGSFSDPGRSTIKKKKKKRLRGRARAPSSKAPSNKELAAGVWDSLENEEPQFTDIQISAKPNRKQKNKVKPQVLVPVPSKSNSYSTCSEGSTSERDEQLQDSGDKAETEYLLNRKRACDRLVESPASAPSERHTRSSSKTGRSSRRSSSKRGHNSVSKRGRNSLSKQDRKTYQLSPNVGQWKVKDVSKWLHNLELNDLIEVFKDNSIDGESLLEDIDIDTLQNELNVERVLVRKKIMREIKKLKKKNSRRSV